MRLGINGPWITKSYLEMILDKKRIIVLRIMSQLAKHNLTKVDYINYQDKKLNFLDDLTHAKPDIVFFLPLPGVPHHKKTHGFQ
ncbi:hypothetical protein S245_050056, partial [Arachis hypogaea]